MTNPHPARLDQVFDLTMAFTTRLIANTHQYAQNLTQDIDLASLSTSKDLAFGIVGIVVLLAAFAQWIIKTYKFWQYPFVNKASWWNASKVKENYLWNAQKLLVDGFHEVCILGLLVLSAIPQMVLSDMTAVSQRLCHGYRHGSYCSSLPRVRKRGP
jgi:hypothetical protein